jgi:tripartite ATP-independent transporter DctP family solute receptor
VVKIANQWGEASVHTQFIEDFLIPRIEELTDGRATCEFYSNNSLGNEIDQCGQVQAGALNIAIISDQSASLDPAHLNIGVLPFLFENDDMFDAVMSLDSELGQEIVGNLPDTGVTCLGFTDNGFKVITNNVRPINSVDDMKGLKMRTNSADYVIALFEAFGASCVSMTLGEVYSALETGTVNGQDNAYNTILTSGFTEVQDYMAITNHIKGTLYLVGSTTWLDSLPDDIRSAIEQACTEACDYQRKIYREAAESDHQALLDAGMEETTPDLEGFKEAAQAVYEKYYSEYPECEELIERIKNVEY